jgi:Cupin-like domain
MDLSRKIDVVENIEVEEFRKNYLKQQTPVIIKGLAKNKIAGEKWSINYFKETMGNLNIGVYNGGSKKSTSSAHTTPDIEMKLNDYLSIIEKNEPTDLRIFLFNFFKLNPKLQEEFPCPVIFKGVLDNIGHMFFGGKNTTVRIHYDIDMSNVLLTHFGGKKKVVLISPEYTDLLYRLPFNTFSLINLDKPDYEKYAGLEYIIGYECILQPGDSLFIPSGYWHYMTYLEGGFSISYRKIAPTIETKIQGLMNVAVLMPFDKLMGRILGHKWLAIKEQIAKTKAEKAIQKIDSKIFLSS